MKEKIIESLLKLDVTNDNQWTTEGLPKLDSLKFLVGSAVTREDVVAAAPNFTRSTPVVAEVQDAPNETKQDEVVATNEALEQVQGETGAFKVADGQVHISTAVSETAAASNVVTNEPTKPTTLTVGLDFTVSDMVKAMLDPFEFVDVKELSTEDLEALNVKVQAGLVADAAFQSTVAQFVNDRALYANTVIHELDKRRPKVHLADNLHAFRESMTGELHPIDIPRQVVRNGRR